MKAGWEVRKLKELCDDFKADIVDGPFGANLKREHYTSDGTPVLKIQNIKPFQIVLKKMDFISEQKASELARHSYRNGDIIITKLGQPLGVSAIVNDLDPGIIVADLVRVRATKVDTQFLCYQLNSPLVSKHLNSLQKGTTRPRVQISAVRDLPINLPPLEEQKRIVSILDEAFEGLDRARENAEANLKSARELFANLLNATFESNNEQWSHSNLGAACQFIGGSQPPKANFTLEDGEGLIRLVQIRDYKSDKNITFIPRRLARRFCTANDVMIGRYGPPLFQILRGIEGAYNVALMKAEPNPELLSKDYLYFFLRNGRILKYIIDASNRAAGQIGLNKATIEPYPISYPNLAEQSRIVAELEKAEIHCKSLETKYCTKLQDIADLRQSLLQKAFAGELT